MSKRTQVLVIIGVVAIALLGGVVGFLIANDSADDDGALVTDGSTTTSAPADSSTTSTTAGPSTGDIAPPTPIPTDGLTGPALDLATSINRASGLTYHAVYEANGPSSTGGASRSKLEVWRQDPLARRDFYIESDGGTLHTMELRLRDRLLGCTDKNKGDVDPDWVCVPKPDKGKDPADPVAGQARPTDGTVTTTTETIAGAPSTCFTVTSAARAQQVCFDGDGIPTLIDGGGAGGKFLRISLGRGVDPATIAIPEGAELQSGTTTTVAGPA